MSPYFDVVFRKGSERNAPDGGSDQLSINDIDTQMFAPQLTVPDFDSNIFSDCFETDNKSGTRDGGNLPNSLYDDPYAEVDSPTATRML